MNKSMKRVLSTVLAGAALLAVSQAQATVTWQWAYSGTGVTASGTFTTAGAATSPEDILSFTGQRNGQAILGLVPLDADPRFSYDNQFTVVGNHFTSDGVLFDVGGGEAGIVNLYFFQGAYSDLVVVNDEPFETPISFTVSAVPEASTLGYMAFGLGVIGVGLRRRSARASNGTLQAA